jgi:hypothetical protein
MPVPETQKIPLFSAITLYIVFLRMSMAFGFDFNSFIMYNNAEKLICEVFIMKKVVLLGDSIRLIGYGLKVPELLGDEYEV